MRAEINHMMTDFPEDRLWEKPFDRASPGFHLQHIRGVIDRLFSYAREEALTEEQLEWLKGEGRNTSFSLRELMDGLNRQVDLALDQLMHTDPAGLTAVRYVGRKRIPSTVIGLLIHAAEHSMRHAGQLLVTVHALRQGNAQS
jgi:uncharacterized damage-inducible protein DinB